MTIINDGNGISDDDVAGGRWQEERGWMRRREEKDGAEGAALKKKTSFITVGNKITTKPPNRESNLD